MKFALIICQYNVVDYLKQCLAPWIEAKKTYDIDIYCLDGKFDDFDGETESTDGSLALLRDYDANKSIYLIEHSSRFKEHEVRNIAVKRAFRDNPPDYIINWGIDEIATSNEVLYILKHAIDNPLYAYFRVNYKNFVFDKNHYVLGFCPPRIFKVDYNGHKLQKFYWDDDILYVKDESPVQYTVLPNNVVPNVKINHYTWCDYERSKKKIEYQSKHFASGAGCSFKFDDATKTISFNEEYYKKTGQPYPEVLSV